MMRFCSEHGDCTPRHGPRYLSFLDETASKFRRRTRAHFGGEIEVITEGFKLLSSIFCGLLGFSEVDNEADNNLKSARTTLAIRVLTNLQAGYILQEAGFVEECLSLCRDALEATYTLKYLERHPAKADAWFKTAFERDNDLGFKRMVEDLGDTEVYRDYVSLCKHTHATGMAYWNHISLGPEWDLRKHKEAYFWLVRVMYLYVNMFLDVFSGKVFSCDDVSRKYVLRCKQLMRSLAKEMHEDISVLKRLK